MKKTTGSGNYIKGGNRMKKKLSFLFVMVLILSIFNNSPVAYAASHNISISYFENYYSNGSTLSASKSQSMTLRNISKIDITNTSISVMGQGTKGRAFFIFVQINEGSFDTPQDYLGNYDVLSVLDLVSFIRIVLKDKFAPNMLYVDVPMDNSASRAQYGNYNATWYREFVTSDIILEEEIESEPTRNSTASTIKLYSSTNNIYGSIVSEYMRIIAIRSYPSSINNQTGGSFYFTLGIKDKWTEYTPYGGSKITTDGCSLGMNCGQINVATPKGEYFSSMTTYFRGTMYNYSNPLSFGFNLNIPYTPFSITYTYTHNEDGYGQYYYKPYPATTHKATQVGNIWDSRGYWTYNAAGTDEDVGDYFYANLAVDTDTAYQVLGSKSISFKWDYHITGTGISTTYGASVNTPSIFDSITNTVQYTLTAS